MQSMGSCSGPRMLSCWLHVGGAGADKPGGVCRSAQRRPSAGPERGPRQQRPCVPAAQQHRGARLVAAWQAPRRFIKSKRGRLRLLLHDGVDASHGSAVFLLRWPSCLLPHRAYGRVT